MKRNEMTSVSPKEAYDLIGKGAVLVDVRGNYLNEFKLYDVGETIFSSLMELPQQIDELPKNKPLIIACTSGMRSRSATKFLIENGFSNALNMSGGIMEWERKGLPVKNGERQSWTDSLLGIFKKKESKN